MGNKTRKLFETSKRNWKVVYKKFAQGCCLGDRNDVGVALSKQQHEE